MDSEVTGLVNAAGKLLHDRRRLHQQSIDGVKSMNIRDPKLSREGVGEHVTMLITRFLSPANN